MIEIRIRLSKNMSITTLMPFVIGEIAIQLYNARTQGKRGLGMKGMFLFFILKFFYPVTMAALWQPVESMK